MEPRRYTAQYVQFRKDVLKTTRQDVKNWSYKDFIESGYVRANLTTSKKCYVKPFTGIMSVFKDSEILFSFNK